MRKFLFTASILLIAIVAFGSVFGGISSSKVDAEYYPTSATVMALDYEAMANIATYMEVEITTTAELTAAMVIYLYGLESNIIVNLIQRTHPRQSENRLRLSAAQQGQYDVEAIGDDTRSKDIIDLTMRWRA